MKYSKIYKVDGKQFRYNYDYSELEWYDKDHGVLESIGVNKQDFEENPTATMEMFSDMINEELSFQIESCMEEFC